jgi:hypothetical protein
MPVPVTSRNTDKTGGVVTPGVAPLLRLLPTERAEQHIVAVTFRTADNRRWYAVGGGETIAAAIEWARESCPDGMLWEADTWNDLYGD